MRRTWITAGLVALGLAFAAPASATAPDWTRLRADLAAVGPGTSLRAKVSAAQAAASRGQPCTALNVLQALRREVRAQTSRRIDPATVARVDADVLAIDAQLLTSPGSEACGGTSVPAVQAPEPHVDVLASDPSGLTLRVSFPPATFVPRLGREIPFTDLAMAGLDSMGGVGKPNVPAFSRFFAVPIGGRVAVLARGSTSYTLPGVRLWPEQDQAADASPFAAPPFTIDPSAYGANAFYPASPQAGSQLGMMRDLQVGSVQADGAQYNPVTQALRVYTSMELRVDFGPSSGLFGDSRTTSLWNLGAQELYSSALLNWNVAARFVGLSRFLLCGEEYLIVTSHALRPAADTLAAARTADGLSTSVVEVGSGPGQIGTTAPQVWSYIHDELTSSCVRRPEYVGILGDTANVPTFFPSSPWYNAKTGSGTGFDGLIASDAIYGLADLADLLPDLAVGRMPAPNLTVATAEVNKIIGYEDTPPVNAGFYSNATVTSLFQCGIDDGGTPCNPGTRDERTFTMASETARNGMLGEGYTVDRVYTTPAVMPQQFSDGTALPAGLLKPGFPWSGMGTTLQNDWNAGRFLIFHRDHGAPSGWANPNFDTTGIPGLTNGALLPVVFGINCASGKFDDPSPNFSEQLIERPSGGAVGVVGDSRNSPSSTNSQLAVGLFDAIFPGTLPAYGSAKPITRMGDVLVAAKVYMSGVSGPANGWTQAELLLYHWFGDPTMRIWKHQPAHYLVADAVILAALDKIVVSLRQEAAAGSVVTLWQGNRALGRALLENGQAIIVPEEPPSLTSEAPVYLTLEQNGFQAAQLPIPVIRPPRG